MNFETSCHPDGIERHCLSLRDYVRVFFPLIEVFAEHDATEDYGIVRLKALGLPARKDLSVVKRVYDPKRSSERIIRDGVSCAPNLMRDVRRALKRSGFDADLGLVDLTDLPADLRGPLHTIRHPYDPDEYLVADDHPTLILRWQHVLPDSSRREKGARKVAQKKAVTTPRLYEIGAKCCECAQWTASLGGRFKCTRWAVVDCE